jgi:thiamine biosynthesis lipoprotein
MLTDRRNPVSIPGPLQRHVINGATMGTRYSAVFYAPAGDHSGLGHALQAAVDAVDAQMSTWKPDSDLMRFNRAPAGLWFDIPEQFCAVLSAAIEIGRLSDGAFDIGVGDLVSAWGFGSGHAAGSPERAAAAKDSPRRPAHLCLDLDRERLRLRKQGEITLDLSGIAKGFGVDELARVLVSRGIDHFLVSIDGELCAAGGKADGSPWRVAVEKPETGRRDAEGVLEIRDGAVATSGDYRHFVEIEGIRYAHTMDPRRRAPVVDGPAAVTVLAETCMAADAWATALLVLGPAAGGDIAQRLGLEALFMERPRDVPSDRARLPPLTKENQP